GSQAHRLDATSIAFPSTAQWRVDRSIPAYRCGGSVRIALTSRFTRDEGSSQAPVAARSVPNPFALSVARASERSRSVGPVVLLSARRGQQLTQLTALVAVGAGRHVEQLAVVAHAQRDFDWLATDRAVFDVALRAGRHVHLRFITFPAVRAGDGNEFKH